MTAADDRYQELVDAYAEAHHRFVESGGGAAELEARNAAFRALQAVISGGPEGTAEA